jgi:hypothetical protein
MREINWLAGRGGVLLARPQQDRSYRVIACRLGPRSFIASVTSMGMGEYCRPGSGSRHGLRRCAERTVSISSSPELSLPSKLADGGRFPVELEGGVG